MDQSKFYNFLHAGKLKNVWHNLQTILTFLSIYECATYKLSRQVKRN